MAIDDLITNLNQKVNEATIATSTNLAKSKESLTRLRNKQEIQKESLKSQQDVANYKQKLSQENSRLRDILNVGVNVAQKGLGIWKEQIRVQNIAKRADILNNLNEALQRLDQTRKESELELASNNGTLSDMTEMLEGFKAQRAELYGKALADAQSFSSKKDFTAFNNVIENSRLKGLAAMDTTYNKYALNKLKDNTERILKDASASAYNGNPDIVKYINEFELVGIDAQTASQLLAPQAVNGELHRLLDTRQVGKGIALVDQASKTNVLSPGNPPPLSPREALAWKNRFASLIEASASKDGTSQFNKFLDFVKDGGKNGQLYMQDMREIHASKMEPEQLKAFEQLGVSLINDLNKVRSSAPDRQAYEKGYNALAKNYSFAYSKILKGLSREQTEIKLLKELYQKDNDKLSTNAAEAAEEWNPLEYRNVNDLNLAQQSKLGKTFGSKHLFTDRAFKNFEQHFRSVNSIQSLEGVSKAYMKTSKDQSGGLSLYNDLLMETVSRTKDPSVKRVAKNMLIKRFFPTGSDSHLLSAFEQPNVPLKVNSNDVQLVTEARNYPGHVEGIPTRLRKYYTENIANATNLAFEDYTKEPRYSKDLEAFAEIAEDYKSDKDEELTQEQFKKKVQRNFEREQKLKIAEGLMERHITKSEVFKFGAVTNQFGKELTLTIDEVQEQLSKLKNSPDKGFENSEHQVTAEQFQKGVALGVRAMIPTYLFDSKGEPAKSTTFTKPLSAETINWLAENMGEENIPTHNVFKVFLKETLSGYVPFVSRKDGEGGIRQLVYSDGDREVAVSGELYEFYSPVPNLNIENEPYTPPSNAIELNRVNLLDGQ